MSSTSPRVPAAKKKIPPTLPTMRTCPYDVLSLRQSSDPNISREVHLLSLNNRSHRPAHQLICISSYHKLNYFYKKKSSPVRFTKTRQWLCGRRGSAYTAAESSRVESHESCRVKSLDTACFIFVRLQWSGVTEEMDVEKLILLVKDHGAIYKASRCEQRNRVLLWRWCS